MKSAFLAQAFAGLLVACSSSLAPASSEPSAQASALTKVDKNTLSSWRDAKFVDQMNDAAARDFASCLGDPDPFLRDKIGYEGLTAVLRGAVVSENTRRDLILELSENLTVVDEGGFLAPFSALGLSELVRTDRIEAFLTPEERAIIARQTSDYIASVSDYRAYSDTEGWRHGVAHGADVAMQLALNPNTDVASLAMLRDAIASQITTRSGHSFTRGEPGRLARPIFFMASREAFSAEDWESWFSKLGDPAPLDTWGDAFQSETELARLHNLKAFARVVYINASLSENGAVTPLAEGALGILRTLP